MDGEAVRFSAQIRKRMGNDGMDKFSLGKR